MDWHTLSDIEIDELPLVGMSACVQNVRLSVQVWPANYSDWSVFAIKIGTYDYKARDCAWSNLDRKHPLFVAIDYAIRHNADTREIIGQLVGDAAADELGARAA